MTRINESGATDGRLRHRELVCFQSVDHATGRHGAVERSDIGMIIHHGASREVLWHDGYADEVRDDGSIPGIGRVHPIGRRMSIAGAAAYMNRWQRVTASLEEDE